MAAQSLDAFEYLRADLTLISQALDAAMNERRTGANVLLYGPPGTGKTELVRVLARHLRADLYEVSHQDDDNDSLSGWQRFRHYMLCQRILSRKPRALILFDEIEDVIPHHLSLLFSGEKEHGKRKAWINKLLETNGTPAVWVSNRVDYIDPAILRRFDHLLEIPVLPLRARERIVRKYGARLDINAEAAKSIARNEKLTPADVERASKVVARADFDADSDSDLTCKALVRVINNSMIARGKPLVSLGTTSTIMGEYRHDAANCDQNLDELADALKTRPHARLCLYGPPGTAKTAFVRSLADASDTPLVQKKASDLLSAWLGDTEANIARMFHEAQRQQAVLLLDEADSFLQDRRRTQRSWEITQVNALLVQMENFDGLFFCCTNLMENLDEASLRRFDIKVRFDFLKADQTCASGLLGKIAPYILVGAVQVALILIAGRLLFGVPIVGSLVLLVALTMLFVVANLSVGYTFSTIAQNQLQAMQMAVLFFLPSLLLSGFLFPFLGMPRWAQWLARRCRSLIACASFAVSCSRALLSRICPRRCSRWAVHARRDERRGRALPADSGLAPSHRDKAHAHAHRSRSGSRILVWPRGRRPGRSPGAQ